MKCELNIYVCDCEECGFCEDKRKIEREEALKAIRTMDYPTAEICLRLLEKYLDANEEERLCINCDESGNWDLSIKHR